MSGFNGMNRWEAWYAANRRYIDREHLKTVSGQLVKMFLKQDRRN